MQSHSNFICLLSAVITQLFTSDVSECRQYPRFRNSTSLTLPTEQLEEDFVSTLVISTDNDNKQEQLTTLLPPDTSSVTILPNVSSEFSKPVERTESFNVTDKIVQVYSAVPFFSNDTRITTNSYLDLTANSSKPVIAIHTTLITTQVTLNNTRNVADMIIQLQNQVLTLSNDAKNPANADHIVSILQQLAVAEKVGKYTDQIRDGVVALSNLLSQFNSNDGVAIARCCVQVMSILAAVTGPAGLIMSGFGAIVAMLLNFFNNSPSMDALILQAFDRARAREIGAEAYATMKVYALSQSYLNAYRDQQQNLSCQDASALISNLPVLQGVELLGKLENFITTGSIDPAQVQLIMGLGEFYVQLVSVREALLLDMYQILHNFDSSNSAKCLLPAATQGILNVISTSRELESNLWRSFLIPEADFKQINLASSFRSDLYPLIALRMRAVGLAPETVLTPIQQCLLNATKLRNVEFPNYYAYTTSSPRSCWGVYKGDPGPQGYWSFELTNRLVQPANIDVGFDGKGSRIWHETDLEETNSSTKIVENPGGIYVRLSTQKWPQFYSTPRRYGWMCSREKFGAAVKFIPVRPKNENSVIEAGRQFVIAMSESRMKYAYVTSRSWVGLWAGDPGKSAFWTVGTC